MHALVIRDENGTRYWVGGKTWHDHPAEAVRFYMEVYAEKTIDLIRENEDIKIEVIELPDDFDA